MFDSQFCSLLTITSLIQFFGLIMVICYRLRGNGRFNQAGLICGIVLIAFSTLVCLTIEPSAGITQGVALVFVAICSTFQFGDKANNEVSVF